MTNRRLIKRSTADRLVEDVKQRVAEVNSDPRFTHGITKLVLFGSYVSSDRDMIGDVDIAFLDEPKWPFKGETEYIHDAKRAEYLGNDFLMSCNWGHEEALRFIRGKNRFISLHNYNTDNRAVTWGVNVDLEVPPINRDIPFAKPRPCAVCGCADVSYSSFRDDGNELYYSISCRNCDALILSKTGFRDAAEQWDTSNNSIAEIRAQIAGQEAGIHD